MQANLISCQHIKKESSLPLGIRYGLHGTHSGDIQGAHIPSHTNRQSTTQYPLSARQFQQLQDSVLLSYKVMNQNNLKQFCQD